MLTWRFILRSTRVAQDYGDLPAGSFDREASSAAGKEPDRRPRRHTFPKRKRAAQYIRYETLENGTRRRIVS